VPVNITAPGKIPDNRGNHFGIAAGRGHARQRNFGQVGLSLNPDLSGLEVPDQRIESGVSGYALKKGSRSWLDNSPS